MATVTFCAVPVTLLPAVSWRVTIGCVEKAVPLRLLLGLVVNASFAAAPGLKVTVTV